MAKVILLNKPFNVLSQFRKNDDRQTLADFIDDPSVRIAGRLDYDSEGLILLTDSGPLANHIASPANKQKKTYWAQVEGDITRDALGMLSAGIMLKDGPTRPAEVRKLSEPEGLWERDPPIRERKQIPTSWIELTIKEGRNRQVRRMTAAVGFPTLRLIRCRIGEWSLDSLKPGESVILTAEAPERKPSAVSRSFSRQGRRPSHNQRHHSRSRKV